MKHSKHLAKLLCFPLVFSVGWFSRDWQGSPILPQYPRHEAIPRGKLSEKEAVDNLFWQWRRTLSDQHESGMSWATGDEQMLTELATYVPSNIDFFTQKLIHDMFVVKIFDRSKLKHQNPITTNALQDRQALWLKFLRTKTTIPW